MKISRYMLMSVALNSLYARAFDPTKAGWKMSADGKTIEMKDGNPIWIDGSNNETTMAGDTITRLNGESKTFRTRAETAEAALVPFKDLDAVAAKKAIETVKNIDTKKLIDAGEVEKVKNEIRQEYTGQMEEVKKTNATLVGELDNLRVGNVFAQSEFIRDNIAVPRDMFEAAFKPNFKIKDGKVEAYDKSGNRIMSKKTIGEYADPNEALEILVDQHPQKATILKAPGHSGGGNNGNGGNRGGGRIIKRADFTALPPNQQAATAAQAAKGELTIVD